MIIKYKNRKLYDSERSRFTTLKELEKDVKLGRNIEVRDHTGNNITKQTLLGIVSSSEKLEFNNDFLFDLVRGKL